MATKFTTIAIILFLAFTVNCYAQDSTFIFKDSEKIDRDFFNKEKLNIIDKDYRKIGTIEPDFFQPDDKLNIYDRNFKKVGTIERDFFNKDKWKIKTNK